MDRRTIIVLTGGPGGGKTALIQDLRHETDWTGRFLALPETIFAVGQVGISPREQLFQRLMVKTQCALEEALCRTLGSDDPRFILCHRGTLDPLAYWLDRGWPKDAFFDFTETNREDHYRRYTAVIHLVTAADGALPSYRRWPTAHRLETPEHAIRLDRLLREVWGDHPAYFRVDNEGRDWEAKSREAQRILSELQTVPPSIRWTGG